MKTEVRMVIARPIGCSASPRQANQRSLIGLSSIRPRLSNWRIASRMRFSSVAILSSMTGPQHQLFHEHRRRIRSPVAIAPSRKREPGSLSTPLQTLAR